MSAGENLVPRMHITASLSNLVVVQSLSHVQLFTTRWTAACQASLVLSPPEFVQIHVY